MDPSDPSSNPLISKKPLQPTPKNDKFKKLPLNILDPLISLFIVTPCAVGFWRGTWQLMDIYTNYFPIIQTLILGVSIHFTFVVFQFFLSDFFENKLLNHSFILKSGMRLYTYTFAIGCILMFRGVWSIVDGFLGVKKTDSGIVLKDNSGLLIVVWIICLICVVTLKCLLSCLAPPVFLFVDNVKKTFTIPTWIHAKLVYLLMHLVNSADAYEVTIEKPSTEKLISSASAQRAASVQHFPGKPFRVSYRGHRPSEFTSTTETVTTLRYPQLGHYRHKYHPKNIQDVIGYANKHTPPTLVLPDSPHRHTYKESSSEHISQNHNDPFYRYKPEEPGDINLLATASVRFAPPIWSNIKNLYHRTYPPPIVDYIKKPEVTNHHHMGKPLTLTLNIYPHHLNENEGKIQQQPIRYGIRQYLGQKLEGIQSRIKFPDGKPKKMTIELNLYPDAIVTGESKVQRQIVKAKNETLLQ